MRASLTPDIILTEVHIVASLGCYCGSNGW